MKQPFCTPAQALRRVLDAAAALPVPGHGDACRWKMPAGALQPGTCAPGWTSPPLTAARWMATPCTAPTRPGRAEETPVTLPVVMKLYAGDAPAAALPAGLRRPHYDRCPPAPGRGLRSDAGADRQRRRSRCSIYAQP